MSQNVRGGSRLFVPAILAWVATVLMLLTASEHSVLWIALSVGMLSTGASILFRRRSLVRNLLTAVMIAASLTAVISVRTPSTNQLEQLERIESPGHAHEIPEITATLTNYPAPGWVDVKTQTVSHIRVWLPKPVPKHFAPMTQVTVRGKPRLDTSRIPARVSISARSVTEVHSSGAANWPLFETLLSHMFQFLAVQRHTLVKTAGGIGGAALVPGFAFGDTSLIGEHLNGAMLESSLTHLTAVSGSNCALVVSAALLLVPRRGPRVALALVMLVLFVMLVGPDSSVLRAAVMAGVLLVSRLGGRKTLGVHSLGVAIIVLLLADPYEAIAMGFVLSVLATLGILLLSGKWSNALEKRRVPTLLAKPVALAAAAQVACMPVLVLLQPGISIIGIPANIVAAPLAPLGTSLGLLALLAIPFSSALATGLVWGAALPARTIELIAELAQRVPFGRLAWPEGAGGAVLLAILEVFVALAWALQTGKMSLFGRARVQSLWEQPNRQPVVIATTVASLTALAVSAVTAVGVVIPLAQRLQVPRDWSVVACDIGQGDAFLLRDPKDPKSVVLVDTGEHPEKLEDCFNTFGVNSVSFAILTHDDQDHVGALPSVVHRLQYALIAPSIAGEQLSQREVIAQLRTANVPFSIGESGQVFTIRHGKLDSNTKSHRQGSAGIRLDILAPERGQTLTEPNDASVVAKASLAGVSVLLLADTGEKEQRRLSWQYTASQLHADIVKVAHHGSGNTFTAFPAIVRPRVALVSVGEGNRYGHPTRKALKSFAPVPVYRTDKMGHIAITMNFDVWMQHPRQRPRAAAPARAEPTCYSNC
jgi:competence protein ComEC